MDRPLVWVAGALLGGILAAASGLAPGIAHPLALVAVASLLAAARLRDPRVRPFVVALCFAGLGAAHWNLGVAPASDPLSLYLANHPDTTITVEGHVRSVQLAIPGEDRVSFTVDVDRRIDSNTAAPLVGRAVVQWARGARHIYPGDRIRVNGKARVAIAEVNPGINGYEDYLRNRGVHSAIDASGPNAVERVAAAPWYSPWQWATRLRQAQAEKLAEAMPEDVLPFVYAIWLGHQSALSQQEYQDYVWSGTAHILSVSGIHAAIIAFSLHFALRVFQFSRRVRAILVMFAVFAFALVAGASVPALRAAIMVSLYLSADLFEREPDTPTALSIAGTLFLLWNPRSVFDIGFHLSFASVSSILIFADIINGWMKRVHRLLRAPLAVSLSVQVLPLPIAAANFHVLPLAAPVANLIVIPILGVVLWLCFATSLMSFVWMPAAQILGHATWLPVEALRTVAGISASLRATTLALTTPTGVAWVAYWIAAALLAASPHVSKKFRKRVLIGAAILLVVSMVVWRPRGHAPEIVMLDVGHGDASFMRMPTGETMLIDGGDASEYGDRGRQIVAPFLWARGVTELDAVMVSHGDRDHLGGLLYIIDNFRVGTAILGAVETDRPLEREFLARCEARGTEVVHVRRGETLRIGDAIFSVIHPDAGLPRETLPNNLSIVVRVPFGPKIFLFTGDIEEEIERTLEAGPLDADVLKVPHHGADTSSTGNFIDAVSPDYAVISTGSHGRRILDQPIVDRYASRGIAVLRTDRLGAVRFTLRDGKLHVESERVNRGYPIAGD